MFRAAKTHNKHNALSETASKLRKIDVDFSFYSSEESALLPLLSLHAAE